ncbi:MAG: M20/M25/M40 family metallo-hydrolase [Gemmatimonadales bacterium]
MGNPPATIRAGRGAEFAAALILGAGIWLGFATSGLPGDRATAPDSAFSAQRALSDLKFIAAEPHPVGTVAHDRIRDYLADRLRALGLDDVHIQSATGFNTLAGPIAATVANVVGRRHGSRAGSAILLMAHYDAVPRSFGAGDNGAGVVAILETMRALRATPIDRDVIVLFSDAEEEGLLGAEAFVDQHPWAKDVGVVLNFDGRGDRGPVFMFQTSPGNAPLIGAIAAGVPDARTNSLTGEVYRHLPSDTDLSIWLNSAFPVGALNFADIGGYTHYHTPSDNLASLDLRVVQQMGDYALGIVKQLGRGVVGPVRTSDDIYFNALLVGVIRYPASGALALAILCLVVTIGVIAVSARRAPITAASAGAGALLLGLTLIVPAVAAWVGWRVVSWAHPAYGDILQGEPYNAGWYLLAFVSLTAAFVWTMQRRFVARYGVHALAAAPLLLWSILGVVIAKAIPGGSYLFAWPLIGAALGLLVAPILLALPLLLLWPPLIVALESGLTAQLMPFFVLLTALVLSVLIAPMARIGALGKWLVRGSLVTGMMALLIAEFTSGFGAARKHPDSLIRLIDADAGKAWWVSGDRAPDTWTSRALGQHPDRRVFDAARISNPGTKLLASAAETAGPDSAPVRILAAATTAMGMRIHLHVERRGPGEQVRLYVDSGVVVRQVTVNSRELADGAADPYSPSYRMGPDGTVLRYFGVPEDGVDLWFSASATGPMRLHVVRTVEGLPALASGALPPRPADLMSKPFGPTDVTMRTATVTITPVSP